MFVGLRTLDIPKSKIKSRSKIKTQGNHNLPTFIPVAFQQPDVEATLLSLYKHPTWKRHSCRFPSTGKAAGLPLPRYPTLSQFLTHLLVESKIKFMSKSKGIPN